jgi:hypothetical protein
MLLRPNNRAAAVEVSLKCGVNTIIIIIIIVIIIIIIIIIIYVFIWLQISFYPVAVVIK